MTDLMGIAAKLLKATECIENEINGIGGVYEAKSRLEAEYAKARAIVTLGLRNGKEYELDGEVICNPPTTIIPDLAKGICWKELLEASKAEGAVKALNQKLDSLKAVQNGYQSINKHLA